MHFVVSTWNYTILINMAVKAWAKKTNKDGVLNGVNLGASMVKNMNEGIKSSSTKKTKMGFLGVVNWEMSSEIIGGSEGCKTNVTCRKGRVGGSHVFLPVFQV